MAALRGGADTSLCAAAAGPAVGDPLLVWDLLLHSTVAQRGFDYSVHYERPFIGTIESLDGLAFDSPAALPHTDFSGCRVELFRIIAGKLTCSREISCCVVVCSLPGGGCHCDPARHQVLVSA